MLVIRSDKYRVPSICNCLVSIESSKDGKKFYVESAKYVDVENDMVFILNGLNNTVVPTNGTVRRLGYGAVEVRLQELFGTRHSDIHECTAVV
jgi:hypothetical protein